MATKESIVYATPRQKEQCVAGILSATGDGARMALEELSSTNSVGTSEEFQKDVIARQGELNVLVRESIREIVKRKIIEMVQKVVGCLKCISIGNKIVLKKNNGKQTIAGAKDVFTGYIDSDFVNWGLNKTSAPTEDTPVEVYEMVQDGDFRTIFGGFGQNLDRLCVTQSQIVAFAKDYSNWLHPEGWSTFFLFKEDGKFFVACVGRSDGRLKVSVDHFDDDDVWSAESRLRVVVPQLTFVPQES